MSTLAAELMACPKLTRAPGTYMIERLHELGIAPQTIARRLGMALPDVLRVLSECTNRDSTEKP